MSVKTEKGGSKADTLVKVVLVFFISLLSFSVGTYVGHQVSKADQRRLALEGEYGKSRSVASTDDHAAAEDDEKISEKEVESLTEEFVNKEKIAHHDMSAGDATETSEREPASHDAHAAEPATAPADTQGYKSYPRGKTEVGTKPSAAAEKVANNQAPSDGAKETRKPNSVLPAVASSAIGKYTVQVASYAEENEAKNHAATLKGKGWSAFYVPAQVQGRTWYRVSVGIYDSNKAASDARAQFMKDTNAKSALVQKIVQ